MLDALIETHAARGAIAQAIAVSAPPLPRRLTYEQLRV
jgi:hypothetical protein